MRFSRLPNETNSVLVIDPNAELELPINELRATLPIRSADVRTPVCFDLRLVYLRRRGDTVAEVNRTPKDPGPGKPPAIGPYASSGHPSFEQLMAEQGTGPITNVSALHGDFWPEEESIEEFLETLYEWRGRKRTDPAA